MKAIILAAGSGSRMKGLTQEEPKCFIRIHGMRLIDWQLEALKSSGIKDIAIVRGYLADSFQYKIKYFDNLRWAQSNMLISLCAAREWLNSDTCIVSYSDIIYAPKTIERLINGPGDIVITYDPNWLKLWQMRFVDPLTDAEVFRLNDTEEVVEIGNRAKSLEEIQGQYMGLLKFSPKGWRGVESYMKKLKQDVLDKMDMTRLLQGLIAFGEKVQAVRIEESWYEVDSVSDLNNYQGITKLF